MSIFRMDLGSFTNVVFDGFNGSFDAVLIFKIVKLCDLNLQSQILRNQ